MIARLGAGLRTTLRTTLRTGLGSALRALSGPRTLLALALMVVATTAGAVLLASQDRADRADPADPADPSDTAFLDAETTADLVSSTTDLVNRVFSVDPRRPRATTRLVEKHLTTAAQDQFRELYAPYLSKRAAGIALQTSATSVAVVRLEGDSAEVLVVAEQQASAPDGRTNSGTAGIRLGLTGGAGRWQITAIDPV